jgi:CBS domain-containing protein
MAGYPEDVHLPFSFDRILNPVNPQIEAQRFNLDFARRLLMVRSGMIGNISGVDINEEYSGHIFYIDNALHPGASGGPVMNYDGKMVGIITERAITSVPYEDTPNLRVPSGAAVALTPRIIIHQLSGMGVVSLAT